MQRLPLTQRFIGRSVFRALLVLSSPPVAAACSAPAENPTRSDPALDCTPHYATAVVSYRQAEGGGFHADQLPKIVLGPPVGGGCCAGSTDVVSLGNGGEIIVGFDVDIVDAPGTDFIVFENAFRIGGDPDNLFAEPGEVAVSEDGVKWTAFPCTSKDSPYGLCAGWRPVFATKESSVDACRPEAAGGDPFDLADLGVKSARFVRIRDMNKRMPATGGTAGFDLDAVAVIHSAPAR